jgi:Nuclease-related domain
MREKQRTERGRGGSTAQQKAERLRIKAERLSRQADAWVRGADREPAVGRKLNELPREYVVLHNVQIPATSSWCDHVVIGAGGIYVVEAKKYSGRLVYSNKMLWHGRFPIMDRLENVQWQADSLAESIGKPVVPVLCYVDQVLPQPVTTLGSVIVCRLSSLMTVVLSSHMTISRSDINAIVDGLMRASPDRAGLVEAALPETSLPPIDVEPRPASTYALDGGEMLRRPRRERGPRHAWRAFKVVTACLVGLAVAAGTVMLFSNWLAHRTDKSSAGAPTTTVVPLTTVKPAATTTSTTTAPVASVPQFIIKCPAPNAGWSMIPVWPGTIEGLVWYDYAVQVPVEGSFIPLGLMTSPDPGAIAVTGVPPGEKRLVRIIAAVRPGVALDPMYVVLTAPPDRC